MNKVEVMKAIATRKFWRGTLVLKKYSPEILITVGVIGVVASTVMACKATSKAKDIIDDSQKEVAIIMQAKEIATREDYSGQEYTEQDYKKDLAVNYVQRYVTLARVYAPAIILGTASVACIFGAHRIMRGRNLALMAAYKAVDESFKIYRGRVVAELGEEKDRQFRYGGQKKEITVLEENSKGKLVEVKKTVDVLDSLPEYSQYAKFYTAGCTNWSKSAEYNLAFLRCQQTLANDMLRVRGHVFLNEVYDMLGIERTKGGAVVGWVIGEGDNHIDFGVFDNRKIGSMKFVNGEEADILLDFNVDGVIYDLI